VPLQPKVAQWMLMTASLSVVCSLSCASPQPARDAGQAQLSLELRLEPAKPPRLPTVEIRALNTGTVPTEFCPTLGADSAGGLALVIRSTAGQYYVWSGPEFEVFAPPKGLCLGPGENWSYKLDLGAWHPVSGNQVLTDDWLHYDLPSGTYRIRAEYKPWCEKTRRPRCTPLTSSVVSNWIEFGVPQESASPKSSPGCSASRAPRACAAARWRT